RPACPRGERLGQIPLPALEVGTIPRRVLPHLTARRIEDVQVEDEYREGLDALPFGRLIRRHIFDGVAFCPPEVLGIIDGIEGLALRRDQAWGAHVLRPFGEHRPDLGRIPKDPPKPARSGIRRVQAVHVSQERRRLRTGRDARTIYY